MPIYEYKCGKCKKTFEQYDEAKNSDNYAICKCGYIANKIISRSNFRIKGYSYSNGYSKGGD